MKLSITSLRFTLLSMITLVVFGALSASLFNPLPDAWRNALGFAPVDLLSLRLHGLLTSLIVTAGQWKFWASLAMLGFAAGLCERRIGTWLTTRLFLASHLTVLCLMSAVFLTWSTLSNSPPAQALAAARDIGPSAGYYGCLGFAIASFPSRLRWLAAAGVMAVLAARLWVSSATVTAAPDAVSADIAHLLALPLGCAAWSRALATRTWRGRAQRE